MKRVLIVSFYFSIAEEIASVRIRGLTKYLKDYGWEPILLTARRGPKSDFPFRVIETPFDDVVVRWKNRFGMQSDKPARVQLGVADQKDSKSLRKTILNLWEEFFAYPDQQKGWYKYAVKEGFSLLEEEKFNAIISSSVPFTCHLIAEALNEEFKIPWVADFRDLWTQSHNYPFTPMRLLVERRLEKRILQNANAISVTTSPWVDKMRELNKDKKVVCIMNGFDPDEIGRKVPLTKDFTITYTGQLFYGKRDPELLFRAIRRLFDEGSMDPSDIVVNFFGSDERWLMKSVEKYGLSEVVKLRGVISRDKALNEQLKSQILLSLMWDNPREGEVAPAKIFEYLAAKRPILSIGGPGGVVKKILNETKSGIHVASFEELVEVLRNWYSMFKSSGAVNYTGNENAVSMYNQKEMAKKFAELLDSL